MSDAGGHRIGSAAYRRISVALFVAGLETFALLYATQPLLPTLATEFRIDAATSALSVSAATLGLGVALLVAGPASEVLGRTRLMFASLPAAAMVGIAIAVAPTWPILLGLRVLQGVVLAGLPAVAMAYLSEEVHADGYAQAAGLYIGGTALGGMSGRLITGALADAFGWRWALAGVGLVGLGCALAVIAVLPRSRGFRPAPRGLGHLTAQTRAILTEPALLCLFGIAASAMGAFVGVFNAVGFRLESPPYSLSVGVAGLVFLVYGLGSIASARAGALAGRHGQRVVEPLAAAVMLAGVLLTLFAPLALVVVGLAVMAIGFFAVHGVASGWVAARASVGVGSPGQASSAYMFAYYLGSSVFGGLAGAAWQFGGWPWVVALTGSLTLATLVFALTLRRIPSLLEKQQPPAPPLGH